MGSATAFHLAGQSKVLGLDSHYLGHDLGSSHGHSRIIRQAYFESPDYVEMVRGAYRLWRELEEESDMALLNIVGALNIGTADGQLIQQVLQTCKLHDIDHEYLGATELRQHFSCFNLPNDAVAVYEPTAGILNPEDSINAHMELARRKGAELHFREPVLHWSAEKDRIEVTTPGAVYTAKQLIVTAGAWSGQLMADLQLPLSVTRMINVRFNPEDPSRFSPENCPIYMWEFDNGFYYGFPFLPDHGIKFGRHDGGKIWSPYTIPRVVRRGEIRALQQEINTYMPGAGAQVKDSFICMYTRTPDSNFVIDHHPDHPNVLLACGFSGHGFKFSPVFGQLLASMALGQPLKYNIEFLSIKRLLQNEFSSSD